jgi:hypothetical protein
LYGAFCGWLAGRKASILTGLIALRWRHYLLFFKQLAARIAILHTRNCDYAII